MEYRQPATLEEALKLLAAAGSKLQKQQSRLEQQKLEIENQKNQIRDLQEKLALQLAYRFCSHTEKYFAGQPSLFNEGEISPVPDEDTTAVQDEKLFKEELVSAYKRNRKGRKPLAEELPRKIEVIDIPESEKQCACGHELVKIGEDVSERLQYIPSQIYVLRTVRPKYACRNCEGSGDEDRPVFRQAEAPSFHTAKIHSRRESSGSSVYKQI
jgi:transposase